MSAVDFRQLFYELNRVQIEHEAAVFVCSLSDLPNVITVTLPCNG
jgi:hypothetical protein